MKELIKIISKLLVTFVPITVFLVVSMLFNILPITYAQISSITINSADQLGPSTVSKYTGTVGPGGGNGPAILNSFAGLGIRHMKIYSPFSNSAEDGVLPVTRGADGHINMDFRYYDPFINDILNNYKARPFIALEFMPRALSSQPDSPFYHSYAPRDWAEWSDVITRFVRHNVNNLGLRGLYYQIGNEPELGCGIKCNWNDTYENYIRIYVESVRAIKAADPTAKVGGPAATDWIGPFSQYQGPARTEPFILDFLRSVRDYPGQAPIDFISWHHYQWGDYLWQGADAVDDYLSQIAQEEPAFPATRLEYVITEWNSEWNPDAPQHSWAYRSSFAATNIIQQIQSERVWPFWFIFWLSPTPEYPRDGNTGLLAPDFPTSNCKRPTYAVFQMMNAVSNGNFVSTTTTNLPELEVIAARNDSTSKVTAVVSNFHDTGANINVVFNNLPFGTSSVNRRIQQVNSLTPACSTTGLEAGLTTSSLPVINNSVTFDLNLPDYSVTLITLTPAGATSTPALTNTGFTPESNFYFLDKLGEALSKFFIFIPKVKLNFKLLLLQRK